MASNSFGNIFRITTWGESHGKAIGVVIDGCPAGIEISEDDINKQLYLRRPGQSPYTSPRSETDQAEIYSGVFQGQTTGAPISIIIHNRDVDSTKYESTKNLLKPGHANYTYVEKYGVYDYRGGGRASARETACRVAAGAIARKLLDRFAITPLAYIKEISDVQASVDYLSLDDHAIKSSSLFCPDRIAEEKMQLAISQAIKEKDSVGGVVELYINNVPTGLGDPVYEKIDANLAHAMLSIPASKGFEIGSGYLSAKMKGSEHNDAFCVSEGQIKTATNHSGGCLGGITNGMPLIARISFKPPSSIMKEQNSIDFQKQEAAFKLPEGSRHDPCLAIRAVPVVEAMAALVIADALLLNKCIRF